MDGANAWESRLLIRNLYSLLSLSTGFPCKFPPILGSTSADDPSFPAVCQSRDAQEIYAGCRGSLSLSMVQHYLDFQKNCSYNLPLDFHCVTAGRDVLSIC